MKKKRFLVIPFWMWNVLIILRLLTVRDELELIFVAAVFAYCNLSSTFARTWEQWIWSKTWHGEKLGKK